VNRDALLSADGRYRYQLMRSWGDGPWLTFVMLNPSTADALVDDPTIRRCIAFAEAWGYGGLIVVNLFALRATDPRELLTAVDPVGHENDWHIADAVEQTDLVVAAWGASIPRQHGKRPAAVRELLGDAHHLGLTAAGHPRHPLYLRADTRPTRWEIAA
jgi:hypothetical protein